MGTYTISFQYNNHTSPQNKDDSNIKREKPTANTKGEMISVIGKVCSNHKSWDSLQNTDKQLIRNAIDELDKQTSSIFSTVETASKIYACVLLYKKFSGNVTPNTLDDVRQFSKSTLGIAMHDGSFAWGRDSSQKYFDKIVNYLRTPIRYNDNAQNIMSEQEYSFSQMVNSFGFESNPTPASQQKSTYFNESFVRYIKDKEYIPEKPISDENLQQTLKSFNDDRDTLYRNLPMIEVNVPSPRISDYIQNLEDLKGHLSGKLADIKVVGNTKCKQLETDMENWTTTYHLNVILSNTVGKPENKLTLYQFYLLEFLVALKAQNTAQSKNKPSITMTKIPVFSELKRILKNEYDSNPKSDFSSLLEYIIKSHELKSLQILQ